LTQCAGLPAPFFQHSSRVVALPHAAYAGDNACK
jgi:hypothetical protein